MCKTLPARVPTNWNIYIRTLELLMKHIFSQAFSMYSFRLETIKIVALFSFPVDSLWLFYVKFSWHKKLPFFTVLNNNKGQESIWREINRIIYFISYPVGTNSSRDVRTFLGTKDPHSPHKCQYWVSFKQRFNVQWISNFD